MDQNAALQAIISDLQASNASLQESLKNVTTPISAETIAALQSASDSLKETAANFASALPAAS